jgi:hypothetical protein
MQEIKWSRYQCHKVVIASKIESIVELTSGGRVGWYLECGATIAPEVVAELTKRGAPKVGDYYVRYEDGYQSWSPAKAFEEGYSRL